MYMYMYVYIYINSGRGPWGKGKRLKQGRADFKLEKGAEEAYGQGERLK